MDKNFEEMLREAEKIRAECSGKDNISPHVTQMQKMLDYGLEKGLIDEEGSDTPEFIALFAEIAAFAFEVFYARSIGSIIDFSLEAQLELMKLCEHPEETFGIRPEDNYLCALNFFEDKMN